MCKFITSCECPLMRENENTCTCDCNYFIIIEDALKNFNQLILIFTVLVPEEKERSINIDTNLDDIRPLLYKL